MSVVRILFVGETWSGSSARSMREALAAQPGVALDEIGEDHYFPNGRSLLVRGTSRLLRPWHRAELAREIATKQAALRSDVLVVYKGSGIDAATVRRARQAGVFTVNIYPDCSPHAQGAGVREAIGEYDLVISAKPFHPGGWRSIYGYSNRCVFVPHGYDPAVHVWPDPPQQQDFDIVMAATWRPQYHFLMQQLNAELNDEALDVGIVGAGWREHVGDLPTGWKIGLGLHGRAYGEWLRRGKIVIAPVHRLGPLIDGIRQPGDEDSNRTYELAAAGCFFLHSRTPYVQTIYDEATEVPMWEDPQELAALVRKYLPLEAERRAMAERARARAVPAFSKSERAQQVLEHVRAALTARNG